MNPFKKISNWVWITVGVLVVLALCLTVLKFPARQQNGASENSAMIERKVETPDGGTATLYIPEQYVDFLTEEQIQEFGDGCVDGDTITIDDVSSAH